MTTTKPITANALRPGERPAAEPRAVNATRKRLTAVVRRRLQTAMTVVLIITGLGAWAVALVQPWAGRSGDPGIITVPLAGLDADQIRSASSVEGWLPVKRKPPTRELLRNPFLSSGQAREDGGAPGPRVDVPPEPPAPTSGRGPSEILAVVKGFRLEVTLIAPNGERWAVINGKDYRQGDTVNGLQLVEVQEGKVRLEQSGVTCLLRMD